MKKKNLLAYVTNEVAGNFNNPLFCQMIKSAKQRGRKLLIFEGREYDAPRLMERGSNVVYDYLNPDYLTLSIISAGTMFNESREGSLDKFIDSHRDLSMVLLNQKHEDIPSVTIDNGTGVEEVFNHLFDVHGARRFIFVTGPDNNLDAVERQKAFFTSAQMQELPLENVRVLPGTFHPAAGREIMKLIIDEGDPTEAIMFANDDMAIAALEYITYERPEFKNRFRITGFDNVAEASLVSPSLTTVNQPIEEMIEKAMDMAEWPAKDRQSLVLPSHGIIRRSCGCEVDKPYTSQYHSLSRTSYKPFDYLHAHKLETLLDQLSLLLKNLQIRDFFITSYIREYDWCISDHALPEYSRLIYAWRKGERVILDETEKHPTDEILYEKIIPEIPFTYMVKPLFIEKEQYGLMVCEAKIGLEDELEIIRGIISNTIKIDLLDKENDKLNGLLPICVSCKKIRNDEGYWDMVEHYISRRSEADFTHTLCPECAEKLYGKSLTRKIDGNLTDI